MFDPIAITAVQLVALFDGNPRASAEQFLRAGRILKAREVVTLCRIARGGPIMHGHFSRLVERIARRWVPRRDTRTEANKGRIGEGNSTSGCRAEAAQDASAFPPSLRPADEAANLSAGPGERIEWTFTRRRDGRVVMEENHEAQ